MPLKILITRSSYSPNLLSNSGLNLRESEGEALQRELVALGFSAKVCPVFYSNPSSLTSLNLTGEEDLIFITRLAVEIFKASKINLPRTSRCFAIGEGTASFFKTLLSGHPVYYPLELRAQNSEGLLALPAFDFMAGRKVFIFKGDVGREFLADELRSRGAWVEPVICYERQANPGFHRFWTEEFESFPCDIVVLTSTDSLRVFLEAPKLMSPSQRQKKSPWITVLPGRMQEMAVEAGVKNLIVLESASNASIVSAISAFY